MEEQLLESEFVTYPIALRMKALGFDKSCFSFYTLKNEENKIFYDIDPDDGQLTSLNQNAIYANNLSEVGRISAPTLQSALDWFEDNHQLYPSIVIDQTSYPKYAYEIARFVGNPKDLTEKEWYWDSMILSPNLYRTRLEAKIYCIEKLCEIAGEK